MNIEMLQLSSTVKELLQNLSTRAETIYKAYRLDDREEANGKLVFWLDDIEIMLEGLQLMIKARILDADIHEFNYKLTNMLSEFEQEDYFFVADIIEFEIIPILNHWNGCITND